MTKQKKKKSKIGIVEALLTITLAGIVLYMQTEREKETTLKIEQREINKRKDTYDIVYSTLSLLALIAILVVIILKL